MSKEENICGEEIAYETTTDTLSEGEARLYRKALSDAEDRLAVIAEIQNKRVADDEIREPITRKEANTILEMGDTLEHSLVILNEVRKNL